MKTQKKASHILFLVHYFPPINSAGAKRIEALSKYFVQSGRHVSVLTTVKRGSSASFSEQVPSGVKVYQIDSIGRLCENKVIIGSTATLSTSGAGGSGLFRNFKNLVMRWCGQLPDPRLVFSLTMLSPFLAKEVRSALRSTDIVVGSSPPWPMLLSALIVRFRFGPPVVLDYRDHFSACHEMPGSNFAKFIETKIDRALAQRANSVVTVSAPMTQYYQSWNKSVHTVMNGFDPEIIANVKNKVSWKRRDQGTPLKIKYLGMMSPDRVPRNFLSALLRLHNKGLLSSSVLRMEYYGECSILEIVLKNEFLPLLPIFSFNSSVPYHQALEHMITADYLIFSETSQKHTLSAQGILTTKLFEYLASGRPIIADIDPTTIAGQLIARCGNTHFVAGSDSEFFDLLNAPDFFQPVSQPIDSYVDSLSRKAQATTYLNILDEACNDIEV
jgi:glycosyltransferase involved in cell wall biosynthesis